LAKEQQSPKKNTKTHCRIELAAWSDVSTTKWPGVSDAASQGGTETEQHCKAKVGCTSNTKGKKSPLSSFCGEKALRQWP